MKDTLNLLFICLGNICRSPAADAIMKKMVKDAGRSNYIHVDSAGIGPWHVGQLPDRRMREHGGRRGYKVDHIARQFNASQDFHNFDYIVVMDEENYRAISSMAKNDNERKKVIRMSSYFIKYKNHKTVPDPYYGSSNDFELALDLIEDGCRGLLESIHETVAP